MEKHTQSPAPTEVRLTRKDIIAFEHVLKEDIASILPFKSYSVYFPQTPPGGMLPEEAGRPMSAVHISSERKLMLPLELNGAFMGVFVARGVTIRAPKTLLPVLSRSTMLCLEKLQLIKQSRTDALTRLSTREHFLDQLQHEISLISECSRPAAGDGEDALGMHRAGLCAVYIRLNTLAQTQRKHGFGLADEVLASLGEIIAKHKPEQAVAARYDKGVFTLLLPEATPKSGARVAERILAEFSQLDLEHELTGRRVHVNAAAGLVAFPQDLDGRQFDQPLMEQARMLMRKAGKAADVAKEQGENSFFAFSKILEQGGSVTQTLPVNRLMVSLGRSVDAAEGQRFLVWSKDAVEPQHGDESANGDYPHLYKGEIALMEIMENAALADIMHQGDPSWSIEPGDRLTLVHEARIPAETPRAGEDPEAPQFDQLTGLYRYRDFLLQWTRARETVENFGLALVRIEDTAQGGEHRQAAQLASEAAGLLREEFGQELMGGRFSMNSLIMFHPDMDAKEAAKRYTKFSAKASLALGCTVAVGLAWHPYLDFKRSDALENCRKALDYAMLLPAPNVGVFDSLAMNIHADRLFSQGDLYGAMDEYKQALLADEKNTLARNSLGICLARLGHMADARRQFDIVLKQDKKDVMAVYNLGFICQRLGEDADATKAYRRCLRLQPGHVFSLIRLGQLAERKGKLGQARQYYNRASLAEDGQGVTHRYLARLSLKQKRIEEAREHLHQALLHDPKDAFSLSLMAKLYMDCGEDPEIAETFARQSVALRPDQKRFWMELARAFEAGGKQRDADSALSKAASL